MPGPVRAMVVDDHEDMRFLVRAIIEDADAGVEVVAEAASAEALLAAVDEVDPDVIVLDAVMPIVDGFEAAGLVRARRPDQRILLCSALVDDRVRERARAAGVDAVVSKADFDRIPAAVRELAEG